MKNADAHGRSASFVIPTKDLDPGEYTGAGRCRKRGPQLGLPHRQGAGRRAAAGAGGNKTSRAGHDHRSRHRAMGRRQWGRRRRRDDGNPARREDRRQRTVSFGDLPRAVYTVKAKGATGGIHASGEATADAGSGDAADVQIQLKH